MFYLLYNAFSSLLKKKSPLLAKLKQLVYL